MADASTGVPSAADLILLSDSLASMFKGQYANLGIGQSSETSTLAALGKAARGKALGDGSTQYGMANAPLKAALKDPFAQLAAGARYDSFFATYCRSIITQTENAIKTNLPRDASGAVWNFAPSGHLSTLDSYLLYLNALNATCPTTPAAAGTLTATTVAGGGLSSAANCPYVVHCLVSTAGDFYVSLPSPEATRVPISGANNALSYQIPGAIPANVQYVIVFRGYVGGASGTWYLDSRTSVTPGAGSYPAIIISNPDNALRADWTPPSWAQCLWVHESAAIFALAYATAIGSTGAAQNPLIFSNGLQLTPNNVAGTPSSGFQGIGNPAQTGIMGIDVVGTGYTAGAIAGANNSATNTQGFVGFAGSNPIQLRATASLNAAGTSAVTYNFYDAAHGYGSIQSATASAATFSGTAAGETAVPTIANGRIVFAVTAVSNGGGLSSGTYLAEGAAGKPRSY